METDIKSSKKSDLYFWKENFETFKPEEAQGYNDGVTKSAFTLNLYDKLMEELLREVLKQDTQMHILDAGGGTGKWAVYFAKLGHKVTMMDVAEPMLEVARAAVEQEGVKELVTIELGDISNLSYEDDSFDFVFSDRNPISHCGKQETSHKAISECYRVLKPGGHLLGCVLNRMRKIAQMTMELDLDRALQLFGEGEIQRSDSGFTHYYLQDELDTVLKKTGFADIRIYGTTVFTELIPTAWLLDEIPLHKLLQIERMARERPELSSYGVRYHFIGKKS